MPGFRRLRPGDMYTATELNELATAVEASDRITAVGNSTIERTNDGLVIRDNSDDVILGRITGAPTGAAYPFIEVVRNAGGTYTDLGTWGRSGTATVTPAVELGGRTDVPTNSIVELRPFSLGGGWGFTWGAAASSPPPPPPVGTWSTTVTGVLTTASQEGGGRKTSSPGTDGSSGWVGFGRAPTAPGIFRPFEGQLSTTGSGLSVALINYDVYVHSYDGAHLPAPFPTADFGLTRIVNRSGTGPSTGLILSPVDSFTSQSSAAPAADAVVAAGAMDLVGDLAATVVSFGVIRTVGTTPTLCPGLDVDYDPCKIGEFRGGILTHFVDPPSGEPTATDELLVCGGGEPKKITLGDLRTWLGL